jgi:hypothetical protein
MDETRDEKIEKISIEELRSTIEFARANIFLFLGYCYGISTMDKNERCPDLIALESLSKNRETFDQAGLEVSVKTAFNRLAFFEEKLCDYLAK